jgi:dienelactone hydrolase/tRNA A-37 threonylcarbamoyl transferase component Bud32
MHPERWKRIDDLLQAALERPSAERAEFLRQACAGDEALEREVLSLVASAQQAGSFMESPAINVAAREIANSGLAGQTVSHYKILEMLGAGGMGVVYKAFDTKLDRHVALKFLPPHLRHNEELKRRLTEEARAASTLDHANIVVIYEIGEAPGGDLFIAMAFHEGVTLHEKLKGDRIERDKPGAGLPVAEALQIARQIASGLGKAHERGIFHRDIKPSNVMVAKDGVARIIDFGLAKSSEATATQDGTTKGTPLYMSPEQASGKPLDCRTDLWSLGAVLYEMLAGRPPFTGDTQLAIMRAIVQDAPPKLREIRPDLPPEVYGIVSRSLEKDPAKRYQTGAEMVGDLSAALAALEPSARKPAALRAAYAIPALVVILLLAGTSIWLYQRSEKRHWAREQAIPEIARLTGDHKPVAAFLLMQKAGHYLPGDPQLAQIAEDLTHVVSVKSTPPGALVEIKDYLSPADPWFALGTTPLNDIKIPTGYLRWRVSKAGMEEYTGAPLTELMHPVREFNFPLEPSGTAPMGMVLVPATQAWALVWSIGELGPYDLPKFYLDRYEVTNRQYQEFVDQGGYEKREYWKEKFVRDGKELSWELAMDLFRDSTGRPGPSTWEAGHFPAGQEDYPVDGVSWYEAAAYAEFAGKSLPVIAQWYLGAPSSIAKYVIQQSNYSLSAMAPVGKYQGLGPWGTYDMAGNVAEWCRNEAGGNSRYILGGTFKTSSAEYFEPGNLPPFNRTAGNGFRCVRNTAALPAAATAEVHQQIRDFSKAKPASDEVYRIYKTSLYEYDRTPLNVKPEAVEQDSADWRKEAVTFDAAYGKERMAAYLFLPAKVRPPYQTVVFFPSARVLDIPSSKTLGDMNLIDYVIKSGRAVLYPVYKGTYERPGPDNAIGNGGATAAGKEILIQESKDLGRSIDYLETRTDIDRNRIGYMGVSMGAALGVIFAAVEDRFKAVILLDGGFYVEKMLPGTDQADFAPRLKAPTLLIAGKFDWIFLGKDALVRMLGAPAADKKVAIFDTSHDVSEQRADLVREVLGWLDKYFGKVN